MNPIPYGRQYISDEDISEVIKVLRSDFLTQGPKIEEFEKAFADYIGCEYAVAVANGTAALHLSALALGIQQGDKVITTPITFAASANCVKYVGGEIIFADIDPNTFLIDLDHVEKILEEHPGTSVKGIIPVDFAGYPVNTEKFKKLAEKYDLWILEDACHVPGGWFTDSHGQIQRCGNGTFADLSIFSFHPVKHIACGEGGMITTNKKQLYEQLLLLRTHGITKSPELMDENHGGWYYEMVELGYNYRLTDFQAALGTSQLKRANKGLKRRQKIALKYDAAFKNLPIKTPKIEKNINHAFHLYVIQIDNRKGLYNYLRENEIYCQVHYIPLHYMPYYRKFGWKKNDLPNAERYYSKCLSLPMYPTLKDEEQEYVIEVVKKFFK